MRELQERQKFKRRLYSMPVLAIFLVITIMLVKGAYSILITERQSAKDAELLALEVASLSDREKTLQESINKLGTPEGIEEEIKSKYNVAKEGERVAVIVDKPENKASTTEQRSSWWKKLWSDIMGRQ